MLQSLFVFGLLVLLGVSSADAHETAAALGVLVPSDEALACGEEFGTRPAIMRTSIGPMFLTPQGTYGLDCPSLHAEDATPDVVATPDGALLATMRRGQVWFSDDLGCGYEALPLPDESYFAYAIDASADTVWVLVRNSEEAMVRVARPGQWEEVGSWTRAEDSDDAFTPDTVAAARVGDEIWVVVAGARPEPALWLGRGDESTFEWTNVLSRDAFDEPQRLSVQSLDPQGTIWLHITDDTGRAPARVRISLAESGEPIANLELTDVVGESISGPIDAFDAWWLLRDGELLRSDDGLFFETVAQTDWKCLERVGERVYACDLYQMLELVEAPTGLSDPDDHTRAVFSMWQADEPSGRCDWDTETAEVCIRDWVHYGSENYFLDRDASECPIDDPPPEPVDGEAADAGGFAGQGEVVDGGPAGDGGGDRGGCSVSGVGSPGAIWHYVLLGVVGSCRRRSRRYVNA